MNITRLFLLLSALYLGLITSNLISSDERESKSKSSTKVVKTEYWLYPDSVCNEGKQWYTKITYNEQTKTSKQQSCIYNPHGSDSRSKEIDEDIGTGKAKLVKNYGSAVKEMYELYPKERVIIFDQQSFPELNDKIIAIILEPTMHNRTGYLFLFSTGYVFSAKKLYAHKDELSVEQLEIIKSTCVDEKRWSCTNKPDKIPQHVKSLIIKDSAAFNLLRDNTLKANVTAKSSALTDKLSSLLEQDDHRSNTDTDTDRDTDTDTDRDIQNEESDSDSSSNTESEYQTGEEDNNEDSNTVLLIMTFKELENACNKSLEDTVYKAVQCIILSNENIVDRTTHEKLTLLVDLGSVVENIQELLKEKEKTNNTVAHQLADYFDNGLRWVKKNPKKTTLALTTTAGFATAFYAACWYKNCGQSLPLMKTVFAPAFNTVTETIITPAIKSASNWWSTKAVEEGITQITKKSAEQVFA